MQTNRIYFNLNDFRTESIRLLSDAQKKTGDEQTVALIKYFLFLLKNYKDGIIGPKKLCYDLVAPMSWDLPDEHVLNNIIGEGGSLEIPDKHIRGNPKLRLEDLISEIEEIAEKYNVTLDETNLKGGQATFDGDGEFGFAPSPS